ncbi:DEKNAAC101864 [Brettanomyces naardenensis]|uniref:DEKNAAC101864 n=1 Tax=Brettanomyces naardenensis TaxID=13370 RepID=A0A448YJ33_BRENA|nr:DEKNAAC101864 [Brettanomyces naardenensis]
MYVPNLMPGDVHRLWMSHRPSRETVHQRQQGSDNRNTGPIFEPNEYPSMPSYTPAFAGALQYTASTARIRKIVDTRGESAGSGFNDESTTLDQLSLEIDTHLQMMRRLQFIGYDYLKPMGINKTMRQMAEEQDQRPEETETNNVGNSGVNASGSTGNEAFQGNAGNESYDVGNIAIDQSGDTDRGVSGSGEGAEGTSILDGPDLDAELSDRDVSGNYDSLEGDTSDAEEGNGNDVELRGIEEVSGDDEEEAEAGIEEGQFFMASEEYQSDHLIADHSKSAHSFLFAEGSNFTRRNIPRLPSTPPIPGATQNNPVANSGATTTTMSSIPTQIGSNVQLGTTGVTSPFNGIEADTLDHDMTVE